MRLNAAFLTLDMAISEQLRKTKSVLDACHEGKAYDKCLVMLEAWDTKFVSGRA